MLCDQLHKVSELCGRSETVSHVVLPECIQPLTGHRFRKAGNWQIRSTGIRLPTGQYSFDW